MFREVAAHFCSHCNYLTNINTKKEIYKVINIINRRNATAHWGNSYEGNNSELSGSGEASRARNFAANNIDCNIEKRDF